MKVNCQHITHVGCCIKRKPRENIKVCVNVSRTSYRQATDRLPTHYQQSADCRPTVGRLSADCRSTVGRQVAYISGKTCRPTDDQLSADCRPTVGRQVFWGALLHNYRFMLVQQVLHFSKKQTLLSRAKGMLQK